MTATLSLVLPEQLRRSLAAGHPWVYRDHVPRGFRASSGSWVRIQCGTYTGFALWDNDSPIALRVFSERAVPDARWLSERVQLAWRLRAPLRASRTTAYRWLFGEGDGLPGVTVDLYDRFAVVVTYARALDVLLPDLVQALTAAAPLSGIVRRVRADESAEGGRLETLWGQAPPRDLVVEEHGVRLTANVFEGQKTGLFLDHRDNRRLVRELGQAERVLNLFAYTGGFSINAALGGASQVTSVDVAGGALEAARHNFGLNGVDPADHEFVASDVFEYLERTNSQARRFDLVICDPPSFAKARDQLPQALKAYTRLNTMALRITEPGGWFASASCTSQVGSEAFKDMLADAGRQAKRRLQIMHEAGQPLDHPVFAQHREGRYLKFVLCRALPIA